MKNILVFGVLILLGCNQAAPISIPSCSEVNKNQILINSPWDSKEYFDEMVDLLYKSNQEVRYFLDNKIQKDGATYFVIKCVGEDFCGNIFLFLGEGDANSSLLQKEEYVGSELFGLKWHMDDLKFKLNLIYDSVDEIKKRKS